MSTLDFQDVGRHRDASQSKRTRQPLTSLRRIPHETKSGTFKNNTTLPEQMNGSLPRVPRAHADALY